MSWYDPKELSKVKDKESMRVLAALEFQKKVLDTLVVDLSQLTSREIELLDACMQVYLDEYRF